MIGPGFRSSQPIRAYFVDCSFCLASFDIAVMELPALRTTSSNWTGESLRRLRSVRTSTLSLKSIVLRKCDCLCLFIPVQSWFATIDGRALANRRRMPNPSDSPGPTCQPAERSSIDRFCFIPGWFGLAGNRKPYADIICLAADGWPNVTISWRSQPIPCRLRSGSTEPVALAGNNPYVCPCHE